MSMQQKPRLELLHAAANPIQLASNLELDAETVMGLGIVGFGIQGAGKTNAAALLAEQIGQYYVPMVIFDLEGDFLSLEGELPRGQIATQHNCPTGYDVLNQGLQVIYDLSSWPNDDAAAEVIISIVSQLDRWASSRPADQRIPCLILLDEAAHWLPEKRGDYLSEATFRGLKDTFQNVAHRGRKRGLTPAFFTPRISELAKSVLTPGLYILMKQTLDTDLKRYMEYIQAGDLTEKQIKARIASFPKGRAIVKLPNGAQRIITFYRRRSTHVSHTPSIQSALTHYASLPFDATAHYGTHMPEQPVEKADTPSTRQPAPMVPSKREQCFALLQERPSLSVQSLMDWIGCAPSTAAEYRRQFFSCHPELRTSRRATKGEQA